MHVMKSTENNIIISGADSQTKKFWNKNHFLTKNDGKTYLKASTKVTLQGT